MHLNAARLCLDCEYVHDARHCPLCASETFAYMAQWVPPTHTPRPIRRVVPSIEAPTNLGRTIVGAGALAAIGCAWVRWSQRLYGRVEILSLRKAGELR
jgi:hypothetical protein